MTGLIADIQRFSLHDGPGIRTTVFLKGCNMRCPWCHNPETISPLPEILLRMDKCIGCGGCAEGCFAGARTPCGRQRGVEEVLADIMLDAPYYGDEGGVTLSGGEPLCQADFAGALLAAAKKAGLHTAMESNMALPYERIMPVLEHCDLLLCDLKLWDETAHRRYTGMGNAEIKDNIRRAALGGMPMVLHTPVIPSVNDTYGEIGAIAQFAAGLPGLVCYELLPYHPLGLAKGMPEGYTPTRFERPGSGTIESLARRAAEEFRLPMRIAGKAVF